MRSIAKAFFLSTIFILNSWVVAAQESKPGSPPEEWPSAIEDNSYLVEEAYNQEPGVVQWIFGGLMTRPGDDRAYSFTNEWPVPTERHQLSYTVQYADPGSEQLSEFGDLMLNYRYQLLYEDKDGVAVSPRLSAILPTGNWEKGIGAGTWGWQVNLPVSKRISRRFTTHFNLGATLLPGARCLGPSGERVKEDLRGTSEGASIIYLASERFNLMLEAAAYQQEEISEWGGKDNVKEAFINPGFRYAFNFKKGQLVVGASIPIGLTHDSPDSGIFLYLSWEAPFWKVK